MNRIFFLIFVLFALAACRPADPQPTETPAAGDPPAEVEPTAPNTDLPPESTATAVVSTAAPEGQPSSTDPPAGETEVVQPTDQGEKAVTLTLSLESFCREGPGPEYAEVGVISTDELVYVVGVPAESGYPWVVVLDNMAGETCWLWTEHAEIEGDLATLPEVAIPAP